MPHTMMPSLNGKYHERTVSKSPTGEKWQTKLVCFNKFHIKSVFCENMFRSLFPQAVGDCQLSFVDQVVPKVASIADLRGEVRSPK